MLVHTFLKSASGLIGNHLHLQYIQSQSSLVNIKTVWVKAGIARTLFLDDLNILTLYIKHELEADAQD